MDPFTIIFVAGLCVIAFFLTMTIRRDFRAKERLRQEQTRQSLHQRPGRKR
jgi:hypothetical protein